MNYVVWLHRTHYTHNKKLQRASEWFEYDLSKIRQFKNEKSISRSPTDVDFHRYSFRLSRFESSNGVCAYTTSKIEEKDHTEKEIEWRWSVASVDVRYKRNT